MKTKEIEIEITQKMCDEINDLQDELFPKETQELLGIKKHKPCKLKALLG